MSTTNAESCADLKVGATTPPGNRDADLKVGAAPNSERVASGEFRYW
jgi:hypothetical protein